MSEGCSGPDCAPALTRFTSKCFAQPSVQLPRTCPAWPLLRKLFTITLEGGPFGAWHKTDLSLPSPAHRNPKSHLSAPTTTTSYQYNLTHSLQRFNHPFPRLHRPTASGSRLPPLPRPPPRHRLSWTLSPATLWCPRLDGLPSRRQSLLLRSRRSCLCLTRRS